VGGATVEHQVVRLQNVLAGESIARYMVWDGMRGIDLLESRPEVDRTRIGVAGCSGGGTLTAYLAAIDPRIQAAAPACYITAWEEQLPGTGPQDAEQQFPDQLREGLDHADFATAFAPKPYLIVSTEEDFFPLAGARRAFEETRRLYGLFGAGEKMP
jgi:dienelactone hydrolase